MRKKSSHKKTCLSLNGFTDEMQACFLNAYFNTDMCAGRIAEMVEERFALPLGAGKELFYPRYRKPVSAEQDYRGQC